MSVLVKDVMNPKVVTAKPQATIRESAKVMSEFNIGSLVIMEEEKKVSGIVTRSDIISKVVAAGLDPETTTLGDIMTKDVIVIETNKTIDEAGDKMVENKIKRLPVVEDGKLVGIITTTDLISFEPKTIESLAELFMLKTGKSVAG